LPVLDVAVATGFANGAHFARAFRDRFGMAPTAARHHDRTAPQPDERGGEGAGSAISSL
jgi:transcriptional regulator GlxA family with amidase domain